MFNLRLWNKKVGKSYFKRVSDHCFHGDAEENINKLFHTKDFVSIPPLRKDEDAKCAFPKSFFKAPFDLQINVMKKLSLHSNSFSTNCSTFSNLVSSIPVISQNGFHTSCTNLEKSPTESDSVLSSMGIERLENEKNNKEDKNEKANEDKDNESENKESPFLRSQRYAKWMLLATFGLGSPLFILKYGSPQYDDFGDEIKDQYSDLNMVKGYILRAWATLNHVKKDIVEPSSKKLLPDPLKEPYYQPPYTLVIELMDVFLRPVYDSVSGWRFKKRPGIDFFLSHVGPPLFEVVIFTKETGMTAFPLIESMDQKGYIMYRLFRDSARYKSGFSVGNPLKGEMPKLDPYYQKDLTYLNRDLSKVILIDCDKRAYEKQPDNGLCLEKWDGSSNDTTLYDLASLLRAIASSNVEDVRPVLQHYAKHDKPIEAYKLAQAKMQQDSQYALQSSKPPNLFSGAGNVVSSWFK